MTKNRFDLQTISIKRTDIQADRVLPFALVTEKKEKANPSAKPKEPFLAKAPRIITIFTDKKIIETKEIK